MATMTVSLPEPLADWVETQVEAGHYATPSDYVRELVVRDRESKDKLAPLRQVIDAADASGLSERTLDGIFAEARATKGQRDG